MKYQDLIAACESDWQEYTEHAFVQQLALGTLPQPCFLHYLKQDFLFLKQYARAYAWPFIKRVPWKICAALCQASMLCLIQKSATM